MLAFSSAETNTSSKPIDGLSCATIGSVIRITKKTLKIFIGSPLLIND
jgi:hypothetical protein